VATALSAVSLDDKYLALDGDVVMSGIQALVRLPLDQHRADSAAGLHTATLVSGYRGSPLGGLDMAFASASALLDEHHVRFLNGVNEDLAATAVYGSQLANTYPGPRYDGVLGMWYGKGPGVDRSGDAFRHANVAGVGRNGGVLAVAGDDPSAKSSTVASASEFALLDAGMPVLYPGTVGEVIEFGLAGFALSRYCGSWVGLKIVTNVADAFATVRLAAREPISVPELQIDGRPWRHTQNAQLVAPASLEQEREMHEGRAAAVQAFLAANDVNRIVADAPDAWLGVVAAGKTYRDVLDALDALGVDLDGAAALGVRVLQLGAIHPIETGLARRFARGLDEIVVVEEKRAFVELFLRDALYGTSDAPRIVGKYDEHGSALLPGHGELDADRIRPVLRARLARRVGDERLRAEPVVRAPRALIPLTAAETRTPYFCSGCPHNRSTVVPEGSIANGAVGCSTMAMWMDRSTDKIGQMGGEGAHWIGAAPFTGTPHIFQNMGDGTFLHSGSLAIRQAVAAGTTITYKLLYNAAVAMTGGQAHDADLSLPEIVASVAAEGVALVLVVSDQPDVRRRQVPAGVDVWHRDRVIEAQELVRAVPGVTVLVYDQACAADLRRKRKRGLATTPSHRIMINAAVCEGCGDCGVESNCLSVQPFDTVFGRKTRIDQASCNMDESCTRGHCPAFVAITPKPSRPSRTSARTTPSDETALPDPVRAADLSPDGTTNVLMTGVGGTGVVTVNQILGVAARIAGLYSVALDQTGLAQKGGSVVSHLRLAPTPITGANMIGRGGADVLLAFDPITAAQDVNLARLDAGRTHAVANRAVTTTGPQVRNVSAAAPSPGVLHDRLAAATASQTTIDVEGLCDELFGDRAPANVVLLGAAYQAGLIPIEAAAIERAIEINGAGVARNVAAFRAGRRAVASPTQDAAPPVAPVRVAAELRARIDATVPESARVLVTACVADLVGYQDARYAARFLDDVGRVAAAEPAGRSDLTVASARHLHHLMAYKDEYEVARLHRSADFAAAVEHEFGPGAERRFLLQPPALRRLGVDRKIGLRRSAGVAFAGLAAAKRVRGTWLDPFGRSAHRRMERTLADEFRSHITAALDHLDGADGRADGRADGSELDLAYGRAVALLALAGGVRGYDHIKERNVAEWRAAATAGLAELDRPLASSTAKEHS
jgi:indolepyruvate ferredoxin oxidoreductase